MRFKLLIISFWLFGVANFAAALPFNDDMMQNQMRTGVIVKQKAKNSIPRGYLDYYVPNKAEAEKLNNPVKADQASVGHGKRLFFANCFPCHGDIRQPVYQPGPVAAKFMTPPDITSDYYKKLPDGRFYATIHFGGLAVMPALGWKLSPGEHWDIVNYIRSVQAKK